MLIGIMSDLHLGIRQYGLHEREEDFYHLYRCAITDFVSAGIDIAVIAGDIFDTSRPSPKALKVFVNGIMELNKNGIKVLNIIGNHSMIQSSNFVTADEFIWSAFNLDFELLNGMDDYYQNGDINIFGYPFHHQYQISDFIQKVCDLNDCVDPQKTNILVLHQSFKEFCGFTGEELSIYDIDTFNFDLIICGHIHERKLYELNEKTIFLQPGSLERLNLAEARDEEMHGKGIYIIDTDRMGIQGVASSFVPEKSARRFYIADMYMSRNDEIDDIEKEILDGIKECSVPPILFLTVHDTSGSFGDLMDLTKRLHDSCLTVRFKYFDESYKDEYNILDTANLENGIPTPREALQIALNPMEDKEAELGLALFDALSKGEDVSELLERFRKERGSQHIVESTFDYEYEKQRLKEYEEFFENLGN